MKQLFIFLLPALLLVAPGCSKKNPETSQTLLHDSINAASNADWKQALRLAREAEKLDPVDPYPQIMTALALENLDKSDDAFARVSRLAQNTDSFIIQYSLGRMLSERGKYDQAIKPLSLALAQRPGDPNTTLLLAKASLRLKTREAETLYQNLIRAKHFPQRGILLNELGVITFLRNSSKVGMIRGYMSGARSADPTDPVILMNYAIFQESLFNDPNGAVTAYNAYLRLTDDQSGFDAERQFAHRRLQRLR